MSNKAKNHIIIEDHSSFKELDMSQQSDTWTHCDISDNVPGDLQNSCYWGFLAT